MEKNREKIRNTGKTQRISSLLKCGHLVKLLQCKRLNLKYRNRVTSVLKIKCHIILEIKMSQSLMNI